MAWFLNFARVSKNIGSALWWIDDRAKDSNYIRDIYYTIKEENPIIPWHKIVWNKGGIQKHRFITWVFVLNWCPTKDKIQNYGLQIDPTCLLCNARQDSRYHLYFNCPYNWTVWENISCKMLISTAKIMGSHHPKYHQLSRVKDLKERSSSLLLGRFQYTAFGQRTTIVFTVTDPKRRTLSSTRSTQQSETGHRASGTTLRLRLRPFFSYGFPVEQR